MNRHEFMQELSARTGLTQVILNRVFDSAVDILAEQMHQGERVSFNNFGSFGSKYLKERRLISPQGKVVIRNAKRTPVFKFTKNFKDRI